MLVLTIFSGLALTTQCAKKAEPWSSGNMPVDLLPDAGAYQAALHQAVTKAVQKFNLPLLKGERVNLTLEWTGNRYARNVIWNAVENKLSKSGAIVYGSRTVDESGKTTVQESLQDKEAKEKITAFAQVSIPVSGIHTYDGVFLHNIEAIVWVNLSIKQKDKNGQAFSSGLVRVPYDKSPMNYYALSFIWLVILGVLAVVLFRLRKRFVMRESST